MTAAAIPRLPRARSDDGFVVLRAASAIVAMALPVLIAYNVSPSATFLNQAMAFIGWGLFCVVVAAGLPDRAAPGSGGTFALLAAMAVLTAMALVAAALLKAAWPLSLSAAGTLAVAMLVVWVAASAARSGRGEAAFFAACAALVAAGVGSSVIGLVQVFAPSWADGEWIAAASFPGRATGNVRQPNHLSSLLLWSMAAAVWLGEARPRWRPAMWALAVVFVEVIVLSASRTGLIGTFVLAAWGLFDRRLPRRTRIALALAPAAYFALWGATALAAQAGAFAFEGGKRMSGSGLYVSNARYRVWENTLALIAMHPFAGVGFGEFNFAWTLTPFPTRPVQFFDHAHNLPLHFAAELGIPVALLVCGLLAWALWRAFRQAVDAGRGPAGAASAVGAAGGPASEPASSAAPPYQRAAFVMVFMVAVHSMLEYPLWYSYFLLPACFAFGLCLEAPGAADAGRAEAVTGRTTRPLVLAAMIVVLGATLALYDYLRVVVIFEPPARAASLEERIAAGQRSVFFAHHADYAAATTATRPAQALAAFDRATHFLLDTRLMLAWAAALHEAGEVDKARYLAARLREFRNPASEDFFRLCDPAERHVANEQAKARAAMRGTPAPEKTEVPWQCVPPAKAWRFEDFR